MEVILIALTVVVVLMLLCWIGVLCICDWIPKKAAPAPAAPAPAAAPAAPVKEGYWPGSRCVWPMKC